MRRLGQRLNRHPTALYRHASNKAALLDGVTGFVLGQLTVDSTDPDWHHQLRVIARDFRQLAVAHPHVVPLLVTHPLATPLALRPPSTLLPLEHILDLLTRANFSGNGALRIYRALFGFLYGHVLNELQEIVHQPDESAPISSGSGCNTSRSGSSRGCGTWPRSWPPTRRRHRTRTRPGHPAHRPQHHFCRPRAATPVPVATLGARHRPAGASSGPGSTALPEPGPVISPGPGNVAARPASRMSSPPSSSTAPS